MKLAKNLYMNASRKEKAMAEAEHTPVDIHAA